MGKTGTQVFVINPSEGKRYKMNLKGDIIHLSILRFKKYLAGSCSIPEDEQLLKYNGVELGDDVLAGEVGYHKWLYIISGTAYVSFRPFYRFPNKHLIELESIAQQRTILLNESRIRDERFKKQQQEIANNIANVESKKHILEKEQREREYELKRIRELEEEAESQRLKLEAIRNAEAQREATRTTDLEMRKNQLYAERNVQRALEMQKLENERKKMLLAQQRAEYESEKARLERERKEYYNRRKQKELMMREKECELDEQELEAQRVRMELEVERQILQEQKSVQISRIDATAKGINLTPRPAAFRHYAGNNTHGSASEQKPPQVTVPINTSTASSNVLFQESNIAKKAAQETPIASTLQTGSTGVTRNISSFVGECLSNLATSLGIPQLTLDDNNTCVVNYDEKCTLLVTHDAATERLYLYSTIATALPTNPEKRLKFYEFLMEAALLGRDMCGGGVGASLKNNFILMSTSVYLPESSPRSLAVICPIFVESLMKWRARAHEMGFIDAEDGQTTVGMLAPSTGTECSSISRSRMERPGEGGAPQTYIGVEVSDGQIVDGLHHRFYDGVSVIAVKGPAQKAGIIPQDFIKAVNGIEIRGLEDFRAVKNSLTPGSVVPFTVNRAGCEIVINVLIGSM